MGEGHFKGICASRAEPKIAFIDLFAGPGRFKDGSTSTPLFILSKRRLKTQNFVTILSQFSMTKTERAQVLWLRKSRHCRESTLKYQPDVHTNEVGEEIVKEFESSKLVPT